MKYIIEWVGEEGKQRDRDVEHRELADAIDRHLCLGHSVTKILWEYEDGKVQRLGSHVQST